VSIYPDIKKIKKAMIDCDLTQSGLAEKMGCTRQAVSFIFRGKMKKFDTLNKVAKALKIDPRELLSDDEDKKG